MMGYQENIEFYLKMSRKELQQLCKQHNLPKNRSHAQLAKSLFSLFKKRNARSPVSTEKLVNFMDASSNKSFVSEAKRKQTFNTQEESARGEDIAFCQIGSQVEVIGCMVNVTSEKVQTSTEVSLSPATNKGPDGFGSSVNNHCHIGTRSCHAANIQEVRTKQLLSLECKEVGNNADQKLIQDAITDSRTCKAAPVHCELNGPHEYSMESGFVSAGEISARIPSLQFFVVSEGGINLSVDLSSSPLEWINNLKDGVCVHQNTEYQEPVSPSKNISNSPEVNDHMKISPSVNTAMDLQDIVVDKDTNCTNSSLSSVVSQNCNSEAYPLETTAVTSGSSVLTSGSASAGLSRHLEEIQIVSSSCAAYAVQKHLASDIAFCPREVVDPVHSSFQMVKSHASLLDTSTKSTIDMDNDATVPFGAYTFKAPSADFTAVDDNTVSDLTNNISNKNNLPVPNEIEGNIDTVTFAHLKHHNEGGFSFTECTNKLLDNEILHGCLINSYRLNEQMVLDGSMADAQSEDRVADGPFHQQACCNCGNSVPGDPMSTYCDKLVQNTPVRGKHSSVCSRLQTLDNSSKRSNNLDISEQLCAKKQHICPENTSRTIMDLKISSSLVKEAVSDDINMPRRSTRLVSK